MCQRTRNTAEAAASAAAGDEYVWGGYTGVRNNAQRHAKEIVLRCDVYGRHRCHAGSILCRRRSSLGRSSSDALYRFSIQLYTLAGARDGSITRVGE